MMNNVFYSWRQVVLQSKLAATTKHVLVTLGCHMNEMGESCFPSIETLSEETSLSQKAVITHLDKAEKAGFITKSKHGFAGKKWARNEYKATFPPCESDNKVVNDVHDLGEKVVNVVHEGGERDDTKVVNDVHTSSSVNYPTNNTMRARDPKTQQQTITPHGELACRLIPLGVQVTSMHPTLLKWVNEKIPIEMILECVALARQQKPAPDKIPANYLDRIIRAEMQPKKPDKSWLMSDESTLAYGESIGVYAHPGEGWGDYRQRVIAEHEQLHAAA